MAVSKEDAALILSLARVARAHPQAWNDFVKEFEKFADRGMHGMLRATERLEAIQGRAAERIHILGMLQTCLHEADMIEKNKKG